ncbi:hypothetical protein lerEdw1_001647 [Lerista edwardsae]|nr:hypothetical protein lerEdw1_001647 [Lerista edwardsae]
MIKELTEQLGHAPTGNEKETRVPVTDPGWSHHEAGGRASLLEYQKLFMKGLQRAGHKNIDLSKIAAVMQKADESPGDFMTRLKDAYSTVDPDDPANCCVVNQSFVQQCAKDIRKKVQKVDGFLEMEPSQMMEIVRKVYANRDTEEERAEKAYSKMDTKVHMESYAKEGEAEIANTRKES